jgi:hypothetical protein
MKTRIIPSGIGLLLCFLLFSSCKKTITGPTVTDADIELFEPFVVMSTDSSKPSGTFEWGGRVLNRSRFVVTAAVKLELINPDEVTFFITEEHLVDVEPLAQSAFEVEESGVQVPLPVFSSIKDWNMRIRLITWKAKT